MSRILALVLVLAACSGGSDGITPTDGTSSVDADGDGFFANGGDCNDDDASVFPSAADQVGDEVDQNCDGADGVDADRDGFASTDSGGPDCNDANNQFKPGANDIGWDGIDQDCDGFDRLDWKFLAAGDQHTCGINTRDAILCWGDDDIGQV